jgi:hypothetical protein
MDDFEALIQDPNKAWVDKTVVIKNVVEMKGSHVIVRPGGFGKTIFLGMLR